MSKKYSGKTLIVIDMQNDFIYGSLANEEAQKIIPNVKKKIKEYRDNNYRIIFTKDCHSKFSYPDTLEGHSIPEHCIANTWGYDIVDGLYAPGDDVLVKSSFGTVDWDIYDLSDVEIIGVCTDICVISNAFVIKALIDTYCPGNHPVTIDSSCCAGTTIENHNKALDVLKTCQFNII